MAVSTLRNVGGSVMMAIPKPLLDTLGLSANAKLDVTVEDGKLVAVPKARPKYTLEELLAQCDPDATLSIEDQEWMDIQPVGREII
ncbi:AbrB/MazE/SpoVT family DNA-binding domain-containing protein [Rhizobium sp. PL01]|uniref:AbrB/MazE/SpoVT family DNA-binding domain-containing protein n=1 Tax=Rhizobium sp. PL01 TaxID=3085631 RepID=UPI0029828C76|nr:antitoxin [Rhizobium sp. PL01]MDW5315275.1 antitoxin [Rhizobium sp. PL01]